MLVEPDTAVEGPPKLGLLAELRLAHHYMLIILFFLSGENRK